MGGGQAKTAVQGAKIVRTRKLEIQERLPRRAGLGVEASRGKIQFWVVSAAVWKVQGSRSLSSFWVLVSKQSQKLLS